MRRLAVVCLTVLVGVAALAGAAVFSGESGAGWEPYTQIVDNASERFDASKWGATGQGVGYLGKNYRFARPSEGDAPARFKVRIPKTDLYTVYARWPEDRGFNKAARIGVVTPAGYRWAQVDQRRGGGRWVKVGTFEMAQGDRYSVVISRDTPRKDPLDGVDTRHGDDPVAQRSRGSNISSSEVGGYVVADAIKVKKAYRDDLTGRDMLREARSYMNVEYSLGQCSREYGVDCSCLTQLAYGQFGIYLPDNPDLQYGYGREVERSELQAGDLVFFEEHGEDEGFTHVGIATGRGNIVHASAYTGDVILTSIQNVRGYAGAKRLL